MGEYGQYTDEELCRMSEHDRLAEEHLLIKYKPLVRQEARSLFLTWGDREDLIQEGMIGLYRAIRSYRPEEGAQFATFAKRCILAQMYNAITMANRKKNLPMKEYVSFDSPEFLSHEETGTVGGYGSGNPEQVCIAEEEAKLLQERLMGRLSKLEQTVFLEYISGMNYVEIGAKLGKDAKAIDNAIQRIRGKMRLILEEERKK